MAELHDIVLGGVGYMIAPKSYRRGMDDPGPLGSAPVRLRQDKWVTPERTIQAESDGYDRAVGMLPYRDSGGVAIQLGPRYKQATNVHFPHAANPAAYVIAGGRPYIGIGERLFRPDQVGGGNLNLGTWTQLGGLLGAGNHILNMCWDGATMLYYGTAGGSAWSWTIGGAAHTLVVGGTGNKLVAFFGGQLWITTVIAGVPVIGRWNAGVFAETFPLDGPPLKVITGRDGVYLTTEKGLYRLGGRMLGGAWVGQLDQLAYHHGQGFADDGTQLCEWNGQIYAWVGGAVCRFHAGGSAPQQWQPLGLDGIGCKGLSAAGGYLWAAVMKPTTGFAFHTLWRYDGESWWSAAEDDNYSTLIPTASYFDDADLITSLPNGGPSSIWYWQIRQWVSFDYPVRPDGWLRTSNLTGRDPDAAKVFTRIGAELGHPLQGSPVGNYSLWYSVDGANELLAIGSAPIPTSPPLSTVSFTLPANVIGKGIRVRVHFHSRSAGNPVIRALWAEYRPIEEVVRKRHWQFDVLVSDGQQRRTGAEPRSGKQIAADLWAQWEARGTLTFRDVDYDLVPVQRNVRIVGVDELVERADDRGRWGESVCRVKLVEV